VKVTQPQEMCLYFLLEAIQAASMIEVSSMGTLSATNILK